MADLVVDTPRPSLGLRTIAAGLTLPSVDSFHRPIAHTPMPRECQAPHYRRRSTLHGPTYKAIPHAANQELKY